MYDWLSDLSTNVTTTVQDGAQWLIPILPGAFALFVGAVLVYVVLMTAFTWLE